MQLFKATRDAMKTENPNILASFDAICSKPVMTYWLLYGGSDVDFLSFHMYDAEAGMSDSDVLDRVETFYFGTGWPLQGQSVMDTRQMWHR